MSDSDIICYDIHLSQPTKHSRQIQKAWIEDNGDNYWLFWNFFNCVQTVSRLLQSKPPDASRKYWYHGVNKVIYIYIYIYIYVLFLYHSVDKLILCHVSLRLSSTPEVISWIKCKIGDQDVNTANTVLSGHIWNKEKVVF